jgi:hypothetical protein
MKPRAAIPLRIVPTTLRAANAFVLQHHRHHKPVRGMRFALAVVDAHEVLHGVAIAGRPVSRAIAHVEVLEVTRCCTDGVPNAPSMLYGAVARAAKAMGFLVVQTYTLESEPGISLRAAGFVAVGTVRGGDWNCPSRGGRRTDQPLCDKVRWERVVNVRSP